MLIAFASDRFPGQPACTLTGETGSVDIVMPNHNRDLGGYASVRSTSLRPQDHDGPATLVCDGERVFTGAAALPVRLWLPFFFVAVPLFVFSVWLEGHRGY